MNPHALPAGHSYYTRFYDRAVQVAKDHKALVGCYPLGEESSYGYGVVDPIKGGFILIDWNTGKRSYKDPEAT